MSGVLHAGELQVGSRISLKENYKITKTSRSDYVLLNDIEVFLVPCNVYVLHEPEPDFFNRGLLERVYILEYDTKNMEYYKRNRWYVEKIIKSTNQYSRMPQFYANKIFVVDKISKTNKSYIRVTDRNNVKYVFLLPKKIEDTFNVMD